MKGKDIRVKLRQQKLRFVISSIFLNAGKQSLDFTKKQDKY